MRTWTKVLAMIATGCAAGPALASETAVLAGGCFWCVESNFEGVAGVEDVVSGYTGGTGENPTYEDHADTGHLEAVQITFDPARIGYDAIVRLFLRSSDVVDAGGQFCDRGPAYATAIFVQDDRQRRLAEAELAQAERDLGQKVATPIRAAGPFWLAEAYHQDYARGTGWVLTRRGPKSQAAAYAFYRESCGRDQRVKALWGDLAEFAH